MFLGQKEGSDAVSAYWHAMRLPEEKFPGQTELPMVIIEADSMLAPHFDSYLSRLLQQLGGSAGAQDYLVNLYEASIMPDTAAAVLAQYAALPPLPSWSFGSAGVQLQRNKWSWGTQGMLLSPKLRRQAAELFRWALDHPGAVPGLQDMVLLHFIKQRGCYNTTWPKRPASAAMTPCAVYGIKPGVVQHIGASSSLFGANSSRFHMSASFPARVSVPFHDVAGDW
ncbi:hypothetical protein HYH02_014606 [Chlamydomonas schloesseri]|uniref:Uncharacterized protein n=1 Tax=Chlamydomonas schloesseri TaxID=2026947 RepID=A0A835SWY0_9CHLO|nr:hypothetical protein HYH02_014606 [Chlamydomonas schloesseri]|eukprot:KAG2427386.1 hypothetical protein HYH02_014606 [Chlamydomonas schloesseri]